MSSYIRLYLNYVLVIFFFVVFFIFHVIFCRGPRVLATFIPHRLIKNRLFIYIFYKSNYFEYSNSFNRIIDKWKIFITDRKLNKDIKELQAILTVQLDLLQNTHIFIFLLDQPQKYLKALLNHLLKSNQSWLI